MIYIDKNGKFQDTHEWFYRELEEQEEREEEERENGKI